MSTTRIFDKVTKQWVAVSSSDADNVTVHDTSLLPKGTSQTSAEQVLVNHEARIDLAESHIAWLALHGGGGSGGGGGSMVAAQILVNGAENGGLIEFNEADGIIIRVQCANSVLSWDITASTGTGTTIASAKNSLSLSITKEMLDALAINRTFTLSVNAYNEDTETGVFWNGTIVISNITLSGIDANYNYRPDHAYEESIIFNYEIDSTGSYAFFINDVVVEEYTGTYSNIRGAITLSLARLVELGFDLQPGLNTFVGSLRSANNDNVRGEFALKLTLLTSEPIITCSALSTDPTNPSTLSLFSDSIAVQIPFTVWFSGTSFQYKVATSMSGTPDASQVAWSAAYISYNQEQSNASVLIPDVEIGQTHTIRIMVRDSTTQLTYYQDFYVMLIEPTSSLITTNLAPIFDFCSYTTSITNGKAVSNGYELCIRNANFRSQAIQADTKSLRLQNASYATIDLAAVKAIITQGNQLEFSINIQYRADYHPDDERTILLWGSLNSAGTNSTGLMVRAHDVYLGNARLFSIEDQETIDITITYKSTGTNAGYAFVYVDGVIEATEAYDPNLIIDQVLMGGACPVMYLAAAERTGDVFNFTDCDIYRVAMYAKCLSPIEVLYEHLNNEARAHFRSDGLPNTDYITEGLRRNLIISDNDSTSASDIRIGGKRLDSQLYQPVAASFDNNASDLLSEFNLNSIVAEVSGSLQFNGMLKNYRVPIPIVFIDMSKDGWTYSEFVKPGASNLNPTEAVFHYYDQGGTNKSFLTQRVTVKPQGTSTLADYIKNLDITFPDDVVFSPRQEWFPESTYTLKADIVDSSHSLNPSIGRFVNREFGYNSETSSSRWYPFSDTVLREFNNERSNPSSAVNRFFPNATIKHGVEGFPVLVLIAFTPESGDGAVLKSFGFYQFILGRKSPRNLGYEIVTDVNGISSVSYPLLAQDASLSTKAVYGYWMEFVENDSFGVSEDYQSLADADLSAWQSFRFTGAFWQSSANYYNTNMEVKYSNLASPVNDVYEFAPFVDFVAAIQHCPTMIRRRTAGKSKLDVDSTTSSYRAMSYDWVVSGGNGRYEWTVGTDFVPSYTGDALASLIYSASDRSGALNMDSISKFYPVAMTFGLLDNWQKNLPIKFFQRADGTWEPALIGFYDNDSGIGQDNQSDQNVDEALWMSGLVNSGLGFLESHTGTNKQMVSNNNKMWFLDTPEFIYAYLGRMGYSASDRTGSIFATAWNDMKRTLIANGSIRSIDDLADYYYDNYFIPQTEGCGELLFNLTYIAKYITKYVTDSGSTNQIDKLHGRRRYQVKHWMRNRVRFLDSMFNAMGVLSYDTPVNTPAEVTVRAATGPDCAVTMNSPLITKYTNQGNVTGWMFCDRNVETSLYFGSPSLTSDFAKIHTIQHPRNIIKLGRGENPLYNIGFSAISTGALPFLTVFDVSAPSRSASNMNGLASMNDNYMSSHFRGDNGAGTSELRTIDFRNTYPNGNNTYNLNLKNGFDKLQDLYINNSCINTVTFPDGVPLRDFDVRGSKLNTLVVENQGFIPNVDITGCDELTSLTINNCDSVTDLTIGTTNVRLNSVSVSSNHLQTLSITNNSVRRVSVVSTDLRSIVITSTSLQSLEIGSIEQLESISLANCPNLTHLSFSFAEGALVDGEYAKLSRLDLYDTSISNTVVNGTVFDMLDLSAFTGLTYFRIAGNDQVTHIQFANKSSVKIPLTTAFTGCSALQRIYGHVSIRVSAAFQNCARFSIHGSDLSALSWRGYSVMDGRRVMMPHEVLIAHRVISTIDQFSPSMLWQDGKGVSNFSFDAASAASLFYGTAYSLFDVYWFFSNLGAVTNCSYTFRACTNHDYGEFNWTADYDNSPNRKLFYWANRVTTIVGLFYGCGSGKSIRLYSPSHSGGVYEQDGLFSIPSSAHGLASCTSLSTWLFSGYTYYADRHLFRTNGTGAKPFTNIGYFYPRLILDDANTASFSDVSDTAAIAMHIDRYGNLDGFFVNLGNVTSAHAFLDGSFFVDFSKLTNFKVPAGLTTLTSFLRVQYATGEVRFSEYFARPDRLVNVYQSFRVTRSWSSINAPGSLLPSEATFHIQSGMFDAFTSLESIGFIATGDNSGSKDAPSFCGDGLVKSIDGEFPYTLFQRNTRLRQCVGFFMGCSGTDGASLPGTLFSNCRRLEAIDYLFYNVQFAYTLSDNQPFAACPSLATCSYAFAQPATNAVRPRLTGSLPARFFFTGSRQVTVSMSGNDVETFDTMYEYDEYGVVTSSRVVANPVYDEFGNVIGGDPMEASTVSHTYTDTNHTITDLSYCFQHASFTEFINEQPTIEGNQSYSPFRNTYSASAGWAVNEAVNRHKYSYMWEYDGTNRPDTSGLDGSCDFLDEVTSSTIFPSLSTNIATATGTPNFCCPPDLLRCCAPNCNIAGLFAYCGTTGWSTQYNNGFSLFEFGITGRIPPYLLRPVPNASSIAYMFAYCRRITSYTDFASGVSYTVPRTFFSYASQVQNVSGAFQGLVFPEGINLSVFSTLKRVLNVSRAFYQCYYNGTAASRTVISGVFAGNNVSECSLAFALSASAGGQEAITRSQYVTFDNMFRGYDTEAYRTDQKFSFVFNGYSSQSVIHESPKTLPNNTLTNNYTYSDRTIPES